MPAVDTAQPAGSSFDATDVIDLDADGMRAAVSEALRIVDRLDRVTRLTQLWHSLTPENLPGAIEVFAADPRRSDPLELVLFANAWARIDPANAIQTVNGWRYREAVGQARDEIPRHLGAAPR